MEFKIDRDIFLKSLAHVQGVVEKKNTLPILGNVMLEANEGFLKITATLILLTVSLKLQINTSDFKDFEKKTKIKIKKTCFII